jgi:putative nucleotidyltransferase with HDIG domain
MAGGLSMSEIDKQDIQEEKVEDPRILGPLDSVRTSGPMDSSFPLLKEFREKAPGSHKHAQSLVSMVENVCAAIEMDSEILKMAAMYHDVGKMWAPDLFTENQGKENIHDKLDPWVSCHLITRHVSDTVAILFANGFPKEVIRIASQHHGTCLMMAMFDRAKELDKDVPEEMFRYKSEKPDTLESLILMLCDQVEATSRSFYREQKRDDVDPAVFVINIYNKLHTDGQFDNVQVLLGKLKKIQAALVSDVASNFQKRVKYNEDNELAEEK